MTIIKEAIRYYRQRGVILTAGRTAKYIGDKIYNISERVNGVSSNANSLPLRHQLRAKYYGIDSERYIWLDLKNDDPSKYFTYSDPTPSEFKKKVNIHPKILNNKLTFNLITERYTDKILQIHGIVYDGIIYTDYRGAEQISIIELLDEHKRLFVKPISSGEGKNLYSVKKENGNIYKNGERVDGDDLVEFIQKLDDYIIEEFAKQHKYAEQIYPHTTNTLRIIGGVDPAENKPFIFSATHRFGSEESKPADNRSQGGYAAPVDLDSGELKSLVRVNDNDKRRTYTNHPETDVQVQGEKLPFWDEVCVLVKTLSEVHHQLPLVGWDVVITPTGPVVIEGNRTPKSILGQLEKGYFEDERIKRILETNTDNRQ